MRVAVIISCVALFAILTQVLLQTSLVSHDNDFIMSDILSKQFRISETFRKIVSLEESLGDGFINVIDKDDLQIKLAEFNDTHHRMMNHRAVYNTRPVKLFYGDNIHQLLVGLSPLHEGITLRLRVVAASGATAWAVDEGDEVNQGGENAEDMASAATCSDYGDGTKNCEAPENRAEEANLVEAVQAVRDPLAKWQKQILAIIENYHMEGRQRLGRVKFTGWVLTVCLIIALVLSLFKVFMPAVQAATEEFVGRLESEKQRVEQFRLRKEAEIATERAERAHDAAIAYSRGKTEFLSEMSHEIRTPLNGVIGICELLNDCVLPEQAREYTNIISSCGQSLLSVINNFLDFSKIESGNTKLENIDFDLRSTLEDVTSLLASQAAVKKLDLAVFIDPGVPLWVSGDAVRIRQIITNLVGNALKFTEKGSVQIFVVLASVEEIVSARMSADMHGLDQTDEMAENSESEPTEADKAPKVMLKFEIKDSGMGISEEGQAKLFQAFQQADASITRKYGGTGLGLKISKNLAQMMGGEIGVQSEWGHGSTFWFTAYLRDRESSYLPEKVLLTSDATPIKCILITNNDITVKEMKAFSESLCFETDHASDFESALRLIEDEGGHRLLLVDADETFDQMTCLQIASSLYQASVQVAKRVYERGDKGIMPLRTITISWTQKQPGAGLPGLESHVDAHIMKPFRLSRVTRVLQEQLDAQDVQFGGDATPEMIVRSLENESSLYVSHVPRKLSTLSPGTIIAKLANSRPGSPLLTMPEPNSPALSVSCLSNASSDKTRDIQRTDQAKKSRKKQTRNVKSIKSKMLILVADDVAVNRKVAERQINKLGFAVRTACNGKEALESIRQNVQDVINKGSRPFSVVLMDCEMPEMNGFEAATAWRKIEAEGGGYPDRPRLSIIAMTAHAGSKAEASCLGAGMDDYVTKPATKDILYAKIERWLHTGSLAAVKDDGDAMGENEMIKDVHQLNQSTPEASSGVISTRSTPLKGSPVFGQRSQYDSNLASSYEQSGTLTEPIRLPEFAVVPNKKLSQLTTSLDVKSGKDEARSYVDSETSCKNSVSSWSSRHTSRVSSALDKLHGAIHQELSEKNRKFVLSSGGSSATSSKQNSPTRSGRSRVRGQPGRKSSGESDQSHSRMRWTSSVSVARRKHFAESDAGTSSHPVAKCLGHYILLYHDLIIFVDAYFTFI